MAFRISDELLGTFVPIIVYWLYSGFYVLLGGLEKYRLHPKGEEELKNVATRKMVVKGVLVQQAFQVAVSLLLFTHGSDLFNPSRKFQAVVSKNGGSNPLLGDALVIAATLCYVISNVGEEFCVKKKDGVEFLAMLGCIGGLISLCEIYMFERKELVLVQWSARIIALFAGYATTSFLFYTAAIFLLKMSGATLLNLSLLTSDMWAVLIRIFFYKQQVDWLYYFAFAIVTVGLIIYF